MHHLDFEKIVDKLGSKYEAVIRMSVKARKISDAGLPEGSGNAKVTSLALAEYLKDNESLNTKPKAAKG
jgi:DNA-directed RNA polymerase subunit K/omega